MRRKKSITSGKVLVGGCFDLIHFGHVHFLKKARTLGDYLVVALESDINVRRLKGRGRPVHSQKQRKIMLESLRFVDRVIPLSEMKTDADYRRMVVRIRPKIIAVTKGDALLTKKTAHAASVGAKLVEIPHLA